MITSETIELKLGEYRARHTGKDPFGPWADLKDLYSSLDQQGKEILLLVLNTKRNDKFWKEFIDLFEKNKL